VEAGDAAASARLFDLVYDELRKIARGALRRSPGSSTLETTALVHEAYLKLADPESWTVRDRYHFFALVSQAMRHILIDRARGRMRAKRGAGLAPLALDAFEKLDVAAPERSDELLALDSALSKLERIDPELGRLVEWRFFGGLSVERIAEIQGISGRTVKRHWQTARAYLFRELAGEGS
jgi:RNA polymerase sigma factor (TIGR02999 family)